MSPAQIIQLPDPDQITEATLLAAFKEYAHAVLELAERSNDRDMRILAQLEKLETGQQRVVKEVKGLRGEVKGLRGEVKGLHGEVEGLRGEVKALSLSVDRRFSEQTELLNTRLNEQTEILKMIADNTKPR